MNQEAEKPLLDYFGSLFVAICVAIFSLAAYLIFLYPHDINRIRPDSPLRSIVVPEGSDYSHNKIRTAIVEQLPIGAPPLQIKEFLAQHFSDTSYNVSRKSLESPKLANQPYVFIRAIDVTSLAGGEYVELYLVLTPDEHLKDVVIKSHRAYL